MTTSQSPICQPAFFQRKPTQVQAVQWPASVDPGDIPASVKFSEDVAVIFSWVNDNGGTMVWRDTGTDFFPVIVTDAGDIPISEGDWVVRLPGYAAPSVGEGRAAAMRRAEAISPSRFIAETGRDFAEDYQTQSRELAGKQKDFLKQIDKIAADAELQEKTMPASEIQATTERLGDVVNKGGSKGGIRDLRQGE